MVVEPLSADELDALAALDTPTVCNALELVMPERRGAGFTCEPLLCPFPELAPMVGYARTCTVRALHPATVGKAQLRAERFAYFDYVAAGPRPTISVVQDLDDSRAGFGSFWGEVNSAIHKALGCLGTITNGSVRDLDAIAPGFRMLAARIAPSHAHIHMTGFDGVVSVAGMQVRSDDLIHADRHGAVVIPHEAARKIAAAAALIARREKVVLDACADPAFTVEKLKQAIGSADEIH